MKAVVFALVLVMLPVGVSAVWFFPEDDPRLWQLPTTLNLIKSCGLEQFAEIILDTCADQVCHELEDGTERRAECEYTCQQRMIPKLKCRRETSRNAGAPNPDYCVDRTCQAGEGDCDPGQCASGLTCVDDVGAQYGLPAHYDVCEAT